MELKRGEEEKEDFAIQDPIEAAAKAHEGPLCHQRPVVIVGA